MFQISGSPTVKSKNFFMNLLFASLIGLIKYILLCSYCTSNKLQLKNASCAPLQTLKSSIPLLYILYC